MNTSVGTNKTLFIKVSVFTVTHHVNFYGSNWVSDIKIPTCQSILFFIFLPIMIAFTQEQSLLVGPDFDYIF